MKSRRPETARLGVEGGFSLIELLIAGVIIAMTSTLLIGGLISANRAGELRAQQAVAAQLLAGQLALIDDAVAPQPSEEGKCPEPFAQSTWTIAQKDTPLDNVKQIDLTLMHEGHSFHVSTYRTLKEPHS